MGGVQIAFALAGLPMTAEPGMTGWGWPWPVEGPWSFAANLAPLALFGFVFAVGAELNLNTRPRRAQIALIAATVALVVRTTSDVVPLIVGAALTIALVVFTRETTVREHVPARWTPAAHALAMLGALVLSVASTSYGLFHPLEARQAELRSSGPGDAAVDVMIRNGGHAGLVLRAVSVPSVPDVIVAPVAGVSVAKQARSSIALSVPARCVGARRVDRLAVRMRVRGREVEQIVRLAPPVEVPCSA